MQQDYALSTNISALSYLQFSNSYSSAQFVMMKCVGIKLDWELSLVATMSVKWWTISSQRETIEGSAAIAAFFSQIYFMAFYVANNSVTNCQSCFIAFYVANYSVTELLYTAFPSSIHPKCREMMRTKFLLPKMLLSPKTFIFTTLSRSFYNSCNVFICQFKQINNFTLV